MDFLRAQRRTTFGQAAVLLSGTVSMGPRPALKLGGIGANGREQLAVGAFDQLGGREGDAGADRGVDGLQERVNVWRPDIALKVRAQRAHLGQDRGKQLRGIDGEFFELHDSQLRRRLSRLGALRQVGSPAAYRQASA